MKKKGAIVLMLLLAAFTVYANGANENGDGTFTPNRDVTWTVTSSPGGGSDIFTQEIKSIMIEQGITDANLVIDYVTDGGDVYSYRNDNRGWKGLRQLSKRGKDNPSRYIQVTLPKEGHVKYVQVHRLVAQYFCDGFFPGAVVNHIDGDKHNNDYRNLEWVTQLENIHKSYESSGVNQIRNYRIYNFLSPCGIVLGKFKGKNSAVEYAKIHEIDISPSSLIKYNKSNGYQLIID